MQVQAIELMQGVNKRVDAHIKSLLEKRRQLLNEIANKQKLKKGSMERKQQAQKQNLKSLGAEAQGAKIPAPGAATPDGNGETPEGNSI